MKLWILPSAPNWGLLTMKYGWKQQHPIGKTILMARRLLL